MFLYESFESLPVFLLKLLDSSLVAHGPRILGVGGSRPGRGVNNVRLSTMRLLLWVAPQWGGWGYPA